MTAPNWAWARRSGILWLKVRPVLGTEPSHPTGARPFAVDGRGLRLWAYRGFVSTLSLGQPPTPMVMHSGGLDHAKLPPIPGGHPLGGRVLYSEPGEPPETKSHSMANDGAELGLGTSKWDTVAEGSPGSEYRTRPPVWLEHKSKKQTCDSHI